MRIVQALKAVLRDERGATAIEYGLILALIFLAMVGAIGGFAGEGNGLWSTVESRVSEGLSSPE